MHSQQYENGEIEIEPKVRTDYETPHTEAENKQSDDHLCGSPTEQKVSGLMDPCNDRMINTELKSKIDVYAFCKYMLEIITL